MGRKTDWDAYYAKPYPTAVFSRWFTGRKLVGLIRAHATRKRGLTMIELGGANSCFYDLFRETLRPKRYLAVDTNRLGLEKLVARAGRDRILRIRRADILKSATSNNERAEVVVSIGLIEHFDRKGTARAIAAHFRYLTPHGICVITYPTPTWLYRATRFCSEALGLWIFHDERPLEHAEVEREARRHGTIVHRSTTWATFLTQGVIVVRTA